MRRSTSRGRSTCSRPPAGSSSAGSSARRPGGRSTATPNVIPTPETATTRPEAAYGQSKLSAEGYCRPVRADLRPVVRDAPLRQRLRPPPGSARRGRRRRDVLRLSDARRPADRLRRRPPDAGLRLRRRRRRGQPRRRRPRRSPRRGQHRHRTREHGARPRRRDGPARRGRRLHAGVRAGPLR